MIYTNSDDLGYIAVLCEGKFSHIDICAHTHIYIWKSLQFLCLATKFENINQKGQNKK